MPGQFFSEAERERLIRFPATISPDECLTHFTLTIFELAKTLEHRGDANRLGFALQLCALRFMGFCPDDLWSAPAGVVRYVAKQVEVAPECLTQYAQRAQTRTDHLREIQTYLGYQDATAADLERLAAWLVERAFEHDKPALLFQLAAERLHAEWIVCPGITRLERLVVTAREAAQAETFRRLGHLLTDDQMAALDHLLLPDAGLHAFGSSIVSAKGTGGSRGSGGSGGSEKSGSWARRALLTPLAWLRQGAIANTPAAILTNLAKVTYLQRLGVAGGNLGALTALTPNRCKFLAQVGKKSTNQALQRSPAERRYPILVAFLHEALYELTDQTVELFDHCLAHVYTRAGHDLEEFRHTAARATNAKVALFDTPARAVLDPAIPDAQLRRSILRQIPAERLQAELDETQRLLRPLDDNHFDFLAQRYNYLRQFTPEFLDALTFRSHDPHDPLLDALALVRRLNQLAQRKVPEDAPLDFIPAKWRPYVVRSSGTIDRHYYKLCVLMQLRAAVRAGDLWLEHSRRYADPQTYLIPRERWGELRTEVCRQLRAPASGAERLSEREDELNSLLARLAATLPQDPQVRIEEGALVVSPLRADELPERVCSLQRRIAASLPWTELVDLVIEVDALTHFSDRLVHAGGSEPRSRALKQHLYAAILAQACNFGLTRMAQLADLSYQQLAWCTEWYLREETLRPAIAAIVNYHHRLPLSRLWGGGTLSSSDGQRFPVPVKARNAVALPPYFGYGRGVTFYTWTSDQSNQYGVKVTISTLRDAPRVLDEILDNETELPIVEHTTDTAGFTELVFGLFDLLGLQFSPRIRDLGAQRLYRLDRSTDYGSVELLLKGTINREVILRHWDDLLRVAGSLKLGWVTASLFVTKLQAHPRQNALARALQEYGRLAKTLFILRYLQSEDYRRRIQTQLNKGESLHALRQFLFFAHEGLVRQRQPEDQTNQASCLTLVTNAVVTWNTLYMMEDCSALRARGELIAEDDLVHLSPALFAHINPYGKYRFEIPEEDTPTRRRPLRDPDALSPASD
jgi:TnpA family transposase